MKNTIQYTPDKSTLYRMSSVFTTRHILGFKSDFLFGELSQSALLKEIYENYYRILQGNYRCEYVYKNEIVNQILLKNHKNDARLYTEVEIHESKADVVIMNGTSTVYEIKTELDNFDRLEKQLASYRLVFDKIFVVTHESKLDALKKLIGNDIGIMILNDEGVLEKRRSAKSNKVNVKPEYIFNLLHRDEFVQIVKRYFEIDPNVKPVHLFSECKKLFIQLSPQEAHDQMVKALRKRKTPIYKEQLLMKLPSSLKLLACSGRFTKKEAQLLNVKLSSNAIVAA